MRKHTVEVDGYEVADRLLESVMFDVEITEDGDKFTAGPAVPRPADAGYLDSIKWEPYAEAITRLVQENIDHMQKWCKENNTTMQAEFDEYERDTGKPGAQTIMDL